MKEILLEIDKYCPDILVFLEEQQSLETFLYLSKLSNIFVHLPLKPDADPSLANLFDITNKKESHFQVLSDFYCPSHTFVQAQRVSPFATEAAAESLAQILKHLGLPALALRKAQKQYKRAYERHSAKREFWLAA